MKIIHTADIHLGSKMDSRFGKTVSDERKAEVRNTFRRLVEYAKEEGVAVVMLCGDIFDSDRPFKKDKDFFYSVIKSTPEIDFLYLKGNHDTDDKLPEVLPENLKLFSDKWTSYAYENTVISGTEITAANASSYPAALSLRKDTLNIVMLHGQASDGAGGSVNLKKLKNRNIDYLALGHIHKPSEGVLDERGVYVYCGCLEGRGFDETGEHGFVLLDTAGGKILRPYISFCIIIARKASPVNSFFKKIPSGTAPRRKKMQVQPKKSLSRTAARIFSIARFSIREISEREILRNAATSRCGMGAPPFNP